MKFLRHLPNNILPIPTIGTIFLFFIGVFYHRGFCQSIGVNISIRELDYVSLLIPSEQSLILLYHLIITFSGFHWWYSIKIKKSKMSPKKNIVDEWSSNIANTTKQYSDYGSLSENIKNSIGKYIASIEGVMSRAEEVRSTLINFSDDEFSKIVANDSGISITEVPLARKYSLLLLQTLEQLAKKDDIEKLHKEYIQDTSRIENQYGTSKAEDFLGMLLGAFAIIAIILIICTGGSTTLSSIFAGTGIGFLLFLAFIFKEPSIKYFMVDISVIAILYHAENRGRVENPKILKPIVEVVTNGSDGKGKKEFFRLFSRTNSGLYLQPISGANTSIVYLPDSAVLKITFDP